MIHCHSSKTLLPLLPTAVLCFGDGLLSDRVNLAAIRMCSNMNTLDWILTVGFLLIVVMFCRKRSLVIPLFGAHYKLRRRSLFSSLNLWKVIKDLRYWKFNYFNNLQKHSHPLGNPDSNAGLFFTINDILLEMLMRSHSTWISPTIYSVRHSIVKHQACLVV